MKNALAAVVVSPCGEQSCARLRRARIVLVALLASGCPPVDNGDHVPPRVLAVDPAVTTVSVDATFKVTFSEALNPRTVSADVTSKALTIVLAPRDLFATQCAGGVSCFLSDVKNPPLSTSRQGQVADIVVALVDGNSAITVTPRAPLTPATAYTLVVSAELRDTAGNPLVDASGNKNPFLYELTTDAGKPAVTSTDLPSGAGLVVPNRKNISVTFNQPVLHVNPSTLSISGSPAANIDAILMDETRTTATIVLADPAAGCGRLGVNATYTLVATEGIVGDTGQTLEPFSQPFTTGAACDATVNAMSDVGHTDGEVNATIHFTTSKASTTEVRFGHHGGALDCLGGPCPVLGVSTTTANAVHTVTIAGLVVDNDYDFVASAEDDVGSVANGSGLVHTARLPRIAVNEMLADALGTGTDDKGEFIELASFEDGAGSTDLSGWTIRTTHSTSSGASVDTCTIPDGTSLANRDFVAFTHVAADAAAFYPGSDVTKLVGLGTGLCSLVNGVDTLIELIDPTGRPISSMNAPNGGADGRSIERSDPAAPDDPANMCLSPSASGPTPGRVNGSVSAGCTPP